MGELLTANPTVRAYLFQLPVYVVWLVGIILSMTRWQRHPRASSAALAAFCLFFLESLVGTLLSYNLSRYLAQGRDLDGEHIALVLHMVWFGRTIVHAVLWGVVLVAIFGWRKGRRRVDVENGVGTGGL